MKNRNGFAVTGILYAIVVLFLFLILLVLNNFGARKVLFDKQKETVLEKLNEGVSNTTLKKDFFYDNTIDLQEFVAPKDGVYKIEVWGYGDGGYVSGNVKLYQGIKLYVSIGHAESVDSFVKTEKFNVNTIIINARGLDSSSDSFAYDTNYISTNGELSDIAIDPVDNVTILTGNNNPSKNTNAGNNGYVKINYVSELPS